ncbi:hypothetical protein PHYPSEUDO_004812 [Phytophthora pseudosyringae]|uniref:CCD97-like C-terminal domain-containing protein n=1 Tax=Phytophthora pseudosyringae TaxID=221518 RepID=A0A8T1VMG7_9STRA|nr:hypothetical protein PHYPSEUDO_004812 [Phytophthora pseudosyringae]
MLGLAALVTVLLAVCSHLVGANNDYGVFTPKKLAVGTTPAIGSDAYSSGFTLTAEKPIATLDYGFEVAGLPYFVVSTVSNGPVDVEVKYAEQFPVLSTNFSDGPSQYATAVANSRRVETHRFTQDEVGATVTSMLSQPGHRWQTLRLLSGSSVTFEAVGLQASIEVIDDLSTLPGKFSSSNAKYNEIWELGARAVSAACLDAGSQVSSWSSSEENGTFVPGSRPGVSYKSWNLSDYTLEFETQIVRGGVGFNVGYDVAANRGSLMFHLSSEYPVESIYVNMNTTLFPANTVTLAYGFDFVNATSMTSYILGRSDVPFNVKENVWYPVKLAVNSTAGNFELWLDGQQVMDITISDLALVNLSSHFKDQASFVRNVQATSLNNSSKTLYSNRMTDESVVLPEFGVQSNTYGVCLDGAKRDRYIWLGDFYHTTRIMGVANSKPEQITGTWEYLFDYQASNGQFPGLMVMTYETPMPTPEVFMFEAGTADAYLNFPDYDILGLIGFVSFMDAEEVDSMDVYMASLELPSGDQPLSMAQARTEHNAGLSAVRGGVAVVVKNRRYLRLQQLLADAAEEDHYFSDSMMQQRSPALFHFYLGQYVGLDRSATPPPLVDSGGQTLSAFLMDTCQRSEMETRRLAEQETWADFTAADEKQERSRLGRLFEQDNAEEEEEEEDEEEDATPYTVEERRQQLVEVMSTRFLNGEDSEYVSYAEIDADERLDDLDEMQRDAEERYFAGEAGDGGMG